MSRADEPDVDAAIATVHAALDHGVTLIDTARAYTTVDRPSHNEWLISKALAAQPSSRPKAATSAVARPNSPSTGRRWRCATTASRACDSLNETRSTCFLLRRADHPSTVVEDSVGELAALRQQGKVRYVGLCNVTVGQLDRARAITTIDAVQNRYAPLARDDETLAYCATEGISYLAYSPLGGKPSRNRLAAELPTFRRQNWPGCERWPRAVPDWLTSSTTYGRSTWLISHVPGSRGIAGCGVYCPASSATTGARVPAASAPNTK
ncbi:aldo/keto reductase [Amycolatopsis sp. NPDC005961]|uniref:aldo/keto reductase n=1 Tax=Amycolatopsis sp. NPDC005961 TaxID=3156720 RepID=UPI0034053F15